jgi:hypothetical protein
MHNNCFILQSGDTRIENPVSSIKLFIQNKPNLQNDEMSASAFITKKYENLRLYSRGENKPNL